MLSEKVTVCVFAYNEERRLQRCLNNFRGRLEVLVVDNFSADGTVSVAQQAGCRVVSVKNPGFIETPEVMDKVFENVTTPYVLIASVSEYIPLSLLKKYCSVADRQEFDVVRAFRESVTAGQCIPISGRPGVGNQGELRFFRIGAVDYSNNQVHGRGKVVCEENRVLSLIHDKENWFYQFRDYDCAKTERVHATYDDVMARQWFDSGKRFGLFRAFFDAFRQFANSYLRYGSWRYGVLGLIHSFYRFQMHLTVWFRLWEWEHGFSHEQVVSKNSEARRKMEDSDARIDPR